MRLLIVTLTCFIPIWLQAQFGASTSRYMQTQYFINPAYTGTSNTMSLNLMARKQWVGVDGAPASYHLAIHTPINKTMMSAGGGVSYEQFGVNKFYSTSLSYAYLLKISPITFLSLGINAKFASYQVGFDQLKVTHNNDPYFNVANERGSDINTGTGAFLYSRNFYLGLSVSHLLGVNNLEGNNELNQILARRYYYGVTGYMFHVGKNFGIKPSLMLKYETADFNELSGGVQFMFKQLFWIGTVYSQNGWVSNVLNLRINKSLSFAYAFDFTIGANSIKRNNHEISLAFDINSMVKRNKKREFGVRKGKKDKEGMKSIRHF